MAKGTVNPKSKQPKRTGNPRLKKEVIVAEISEKAARAKAVVFTNFAGMTHVQLEALKRKLLASEAEVVVAKNTLLQRAFGLTDATPLEGPTATLFAYADAVTPLKDLAKSIKDFKFPAIKFGIFEGKLLTGAEVVRLSTLPSREVLIAQVVGGMKSPLFGLHRALNWNIQKLVMTLKAIEVKKS